MTKLDSSSWLTQHDVRYTFLLFTTLLATGFVAQLRPKAAINLKNKSMSIIKVHISTGLLRDGCILYRYNYVDDAANPSALISRLRDIFRQYAFADSRCLSDAAQPFFINITVSPRCYKKELPIVFGSELNDNDLCDVPF